MSNKFPDVNSLPDEELVSLNDVLRDRLLFPISSRSAWNTAMRDGRMLAPITANGRHYYTGAMLKAWRASLIEAGAQKIASFRGEA